MSDGLSDANWRKSSYSAGQGECVEARLAGGQVLVRDSKNPGPVLSFGTAAWDAFTAGVRDGLFDQL
ncbi:DUF397 domain-containing protein [Nocardia brasiliensis]|uniref:DUF397 domain-containing protein n=1 Tax=Nocardia brasiliensis TaxID=37326 RepID=UPI0024583053|nr:DUF397 domain-containing protein [Nocardia brasiliensis]